MILQPWLQPMDEGSSCHVLVLLCRIGRVRQRAFATKLRKKKRMRLQNNLVNAFVVFFCGRASDGRIINIMQVLQIVVAKNHFFAMSRESFFLQMRFVRQFEGDSSVNLNVI